MQRKRFLVGKKKRLHGYATLHVRHPVHGEVGEVLSPCVSVCVIDADTDQCEGCFRNLQEITAWSGASEADRLHIRTQCQARARELLDM